MIILIKPLPALADCRETDRLPEPVKSGYVPARSNQRNARFSDSSFPEIAESDLLRMPV